MPRRDAKYLDVRRKLLRLIEESPAGTRLPSYPEMIRQFKVSQATIDKALSEFDEGKLIERRKGSGLFISARAKTRSIGLIFGRDIFSETISPIYRSVLGHLQRSAEKLNCRYSFFIDLPEVDAPGFPLKVSQELLDALDSGRLDGALLIPARGPTEIAWLKNAKLPLVVMSNMPGDAVGVSFDAVALVETGVESLAAQGCKRIALISFCGHQRDQGFFDDLRSFEKTLAAKGLAKIPELVWDSAPKPPENSASADASRQNEELGRSAVRSFLATASSPGALPFDGLVCTDDIGARGVLDELRNLGFKAGRDFKMASHANKGSSSLRGFDEGLELLEFDPGAMAEALLKALEDLLEGRPLPPGSVVKLKPSSVRAAAVR